MEVQNYNRSSLVEVPALSPSWLCYIVFNTWLLVLVLILSAAGFQFILSSMGRWLKRVKQSPSKSRMPLQLLRNRGETTNFDTSPSFANSIKSKLLQVKSSASPTEGREYCKRLYGEVKEHYFQVGLAKMS